MERITESDSLYTNLEQKTVVDILNNINSEDKTVPLAVEKCIPQISSFLAVLVEKMKNGGRLFYIGAGTSGRLGIVDASECPPTFGVEHGKVIGLIAGGDKAIRSAVEFAEDNAEQGWEDLMAHKINQADCVVGIAASGTTPYVMGALQKCKLNKITTAGITCNPDSPLGTFPDFPITPKVGPEFLTGSTRMKSGTAQKLVLNMISTAAMIQLGHVKGNKMVDMQLSNVKLIERGAKMIQEATNCSEIEANTLLKKYSSVRLAIENYGK